MTSFGATHQVTLHGRKLELANKEYECFAGGDMKTVTVYINRLRDKLQDENRADSSESTQAIQTLRGAGYQFAR